MNDKTIQLFNRTFYKKNEPTILYGRVITSKDKPAFPHYKEFAEKHRLDLQLFVTAMLKPYENHHTNICKFFDSIDKHCKIRMVCDFVWTRGNRCNPAKGDKIEQGREWNIAKIMHNICDLYEWFDWLTIDVQNGYDKCDLFAIRQTPCANGFDKNVFRFMLQKYGQTKCFRLFPFSFLKNSRMSANGGYDVLLKLRNDDNVYNVLDGTRINMTCCDANAKHWNKIIEIHKQLGIAFLRIKTCRCLLKMSVEMETMAIIENRAMLIIADIYILKTVMKFL